MDIPLSPPLKSGPTIPTNQTTGSRKQVIHNAANTSSTGILMGAPMDDTYKLISTKSYEGKQCFVCQLDTPTRHYYLQC